MSVVRDFPGLLSLCSCSVDRLPGLASAAPFFACGCGFHCACEESGPILQVVFRGEMSSAEKVRASHLLVKHQGSRRPASWKDPEGRIIRKTSRDEAVAKLQQFKSDIESGKASLPDLAASNSDCSSAKRGGDLGWFGRGQMQEPFEKATFGLKVGELSDIIDTDSGSHIILRTG